MNDPHDLDLYSTQDLYEEIASRFEASIFCGVRDTNPQEGKGTFGTFWRGNDARCLGLTEFAKCRIFQKMDSHTTKLELKDT